MLTHATKGQFATRPDKEPAQRVRGAGLEVEPVDATSESVASHRGTDSVERASLLLMQSARVTQLIRQKALLNANRNDRPRNLAGDDRSSAAPVQRYRPLSSRDYELRQNEREPQAAFTTQASDPVLETVSDPILPSQYPRYQMNSLPRDTKADLFAADDGTLAMQAMGEAKEFYATDEVLNTANAALSAKHSDFRLQAKGHELTIDGRSLKMMAPALSDADAQAQADMFGKYFTSICRDFATRIMKSSRLQHEAIFQAASGRGVAEAHARPERREIDTGDALGSARMRNVAKAVTGSQPPRALNEAFEMADTQDADTAVGRAYGTASREAGFQDKSKALGINEYAAPEIGEGFATYTTPADVNAAHAMLDYSAGAVPAPRSAIWGYHYAGVVATSQDKKDRITLENYNRADDIDAGLRTVFEALLRDHREVVMAALEESLRVMRFEDLPIAKRFEEAYKAVHRLANLSEAELQRKKQQAAASYLRLKETQNDNQAWYFRIYGTGEGQTFHERSAASGYFANPMTVRVAKVSEDVKDLSAVLVRRLEDIPAVVPGVVDAAYYAPQLDGGKRQMQARTTATDVKSVFNETLRTLTQVRIQAHGQRATTIAATEGIENVDGVSGAAIAILIRKLQNKRADLGTFAVIAKYNLDENLTRLRMLERKALDLESYSVTHTQR